MYVYGLKSEQEKPFTAFQPKLLKCDRIWMLSTYFNLKVKLLMPFSFRIASWETLLSRLKLEYFCKALTDRSPGTHSDLKLENRSRKIYDVIFLPFEYIFASSKDFQFSRRKWVFVSKQLNVSVQTDFSSKTKQTPLKHSHFENIWITKSISNQAHSLKTLRTETSLYFGALIISGSVTWC